MRTNQALRTTWLARMAGQKCPARFAAGLIAAIGLAAMPSTAAAVLPQPPPPRPAPLPGFVTDGTVNALARSGSTVFVGGEFSRIGPPTGGSVVLDPLTAKRRAQFPTVAGIVFATVPDGAGGYYVGGRFTTVGGLPRQNVAHVLASGAVDPAFVANADGDVLALVLNNGRLYIGGEFLHIGASIRRRLASVNAVNGALGQVFNPGADKSVQDLAISGNRLFVGGQFTGIAGNSRSGLAVMDATTGTLDPAFDQVPNGEVNAVLTLGTRVYIGGKFTEVSGHSRAGLAAFDVVTGELDPVFSPSTNGNVYGFATDGTRLFVAGHFTEIARSFNNGVASLDPITGEASQAFRVFLDFDAYAMAIIGGRLYVAGSFRKINEQPRNGLAAVDKVTGAVDPFEPDPDDHVYAVNVVGGQIVAGGRFTSAPRTRAPNLAAVNATTGATVPGFGGGTDAGVTALAVSGGRLFAGGDFRSANGVQRQGMAAFSAATGGLDAFDAPVDGSVQVLTPAGGRLYVGGSFSRVAKQKHPALAAVTLSTGKVVAKFNAVRKRSRGRFADATVYAIEPRGKRLLIGGELAVTRKVAKRTTRREGLILARTSSASVDWSFDAKTSGQVYALQRSGRTLYVGGSLERPAGTRIVKRRGKKPKRVRVFRHNLVAVRPAAGALIKGFKANTDGQVTALALTASRLYVGGDFERVDTRRRDGLAALAPATGAASSTFTPEPNANSTINALLADNSRVFAGGAFQAFGPIFRANLGLFVADGSPGL